MDIFDKFDDLCNSMNVFGNHGSTITQISGSGTITINGKTYKNVKGNMVINDKGIYVDGKPIEEYKEPFMVNLTIQGNVESVSCENNDIHIEGEVGDATAKNGNITIKGNVKGNVESKNGNITIAGSVSGDVTSKNGNVIH